MKKKNEESEEVRIQKWFKRSVTYDGEPYTIDLEQAAAVVDNSNNTIVVARAGSGKTRTIVAKIIYLVAKCGVKSEEIIVFVFNSNAASEINARLSKMSVDGVFVMGNTKIASTFHAFSRKIIYEVCGGAEKCGKILAGEKDVFVRAMICRMLKEKKWSYKIKSFIKGDEKTDEDAVLNLSDAELLHFAGMMCTFINRAQQKYLGGVNTLMNNVRLYMDRDDVGQREGVFVELGVECYKRYHWYLLDEDAKNRLTASDDEPQGLCEYGTDFNLLVSWASKMIARGGAAINEILGNKKYLLIDEYQDFSQLFLSVVLAIRKNCPGVKLFVVGDDWQAINRFAGSEVEYFKEFQKFFPDKSRRIEISTNYRCDSDIVQCARGFMEKAMGENGSFRANSHRLGKVVVVDPSETALDYALVDYDTRLSYDDYIYGECTKRMMRKIPKKSTVKCVKTIIEIIRKNKKAQEILILHRNNEMNMEGISLAKLGEGLKWGLEQLKVMDPGDFEQRISLMTMHKSKGLEAEVVIILEADEGVIPKTHPDTRLFGVFGETEEVALDDQKRLFYVAMTRAKRRLYIIHKKAKNREQDGFMRFLKKV